VEEADMMANGNEESSEDDFQTPDYERERRVAEKGKSSTMYKKAVSKNPHSYRKK
jgi:hypothetical protein